MQGIIIRTLITAAGLWAADSLLSGVRIDGHWTLLFAALALGIINAVIRPVLTVLTLPLTVVTLGLFLLVLNAGMFGLRRCCSTAFAWRVSGTPWVGRSSYRSPPGWRRPSSARRAATRSW